MTDRELAGCALSEVLALLEKATPGDWFTGHLCKDDHACNCPYIYSEAQAGMGAIATIGTDPEEDAPLDEQKGNQAAIVASVNFLRQHGPALLAALSTPSSEGDGRDGERYRWIRGRETVVDRYVTVMPTESERFDAAIDAAMEKERP